MSTDGFSSDEEDVSSLPRSSPVSLGFVDTEISTSGDEPTVEDSFIGGQPVWFHEDSRPADELISCKNCSGPLSLILQAFSPLEGALYDRAIYIFGCQKSGCNRAPGSIRALRAVQKDPKTMAELEKQIKDELDPKLGQGKEKNFLFNNDAKAENSNPFGASSNPFGVDSNPFGASSSTTNPFDKKTTSEAPKVDFASIAAQNAPSKPAKKKPTIKSLPEYPGYFIYVDQEKFQKKQQKKLPDNVKISDSALDFENDGPSIKELNPEAQSVASGLQDKVFQHFSEIAEYNPLQVLRYNLGGTPLLFTSKDDVALKVTKNLIPRPGFNPSSERQFELQMMPKAIMDFEKNVDAKIGEGMEWGTILVYTDKEDLMPVLDENHVGYVEEWVGVQWEEAIKRK